MKEYETVRKFDTNGSFLLDLINSKAHEGWQVHTVWFDAMGFLQAALLERDSPTSSEA